MELLDRYLQAVTKYLPSSRREDIVQELRANILEQVEEKESELGRPLNLDEEEAFFKEFGHPVLVAAKYLPQQYLIGPTLFPYYWFVLKTALPLVLLAFVVVNALAFISEPVTTTKLLSILARMPGVAITAVLWVTAVFAVIQFTQVKFGTKIALLHDWSPRRLPPVEIEDQKRSQTVFELIASGLFVLWLIAITRHPFLIFWGGAVYLKFISPSPICHTVYWAFVALMAAQWFFELLGLFHYGWRKARPWLGLAGRAVMVVLFALLARAPQLFFLTEAGREAGKYQELVDSLNKGVSIGAKVFVVFFVAHLLWDGVHLIVLRSRRHSLMLDRKCM